MSRPGPEQLLRGRVDTFVTAATLPDRLDSFVALVRWTRPAAGDKGTLDELSTCSMIHENGGPSTQRSPK